MATDPPREPRTPTGTRRATSPVTADDPVRRRRHRVARWTTIANRVGYLLLALACIVFLAGVIAGFSATVAAIVVICLLASFALLAPTIVIGYAVKAAEREDAERGL